VIKGGTTFNADLGGSSKHSNEKHCLKADVGEGFHVNGKHTWVSRP